MLTQILENSKQRLLEKMNEGKRHLEKETYEVKDLSRLKKNVEKKKLQLEKDISEYKNTTEKNEEKISEYEKLQVKAEGLLHDIQHYANVTKERKERLERKQAEERLEQQKEQEQEIKERKLERGHQLEMERLAVEKKQMKIAMEERITIEHLQLE